MANHKSAKKRILVSAKRREINKSSMSKMKTLIKKAFSSTEVAEGEVTYKEAVSYIDKMIAKGRLHINTGSRKKAHLTVHFNKISVPVSA